MSLPTGCFDPINKIPGTTESTTTPGSSSNVVETTVDVDDTTDTDTTTETPSMYEGLLGCEVPSLCALWIIPACGDSCMIDETGSCVLDALGERNLGTIEIQSSPSAAHQVLVFRGDVTPDVLTQNVTFEGDTPVSYGPIMHCQLADKPAFISCQMAPSDACLQTSAWMHDCVEVDELVCPVYLDPPEL